MEGRMKRGMLASLPSVVAVLQRHTKPIILAVMVVIAGLTQYLALITYYPADFFYLDTGWFLGLQEQLQQGLLLGRDTYFTYGPLAQQITSFGALLRDNPSPLVGFATNMFVWNLFHWIILAGSILILREVHLPAAVLLFIGCFVLSPPALPVALLILSAVVLARSLTASPRQRRFLGGIVGALWFAGQMLRLDYGIYSLASASVFLVLMACLTLPAFRQYFTGAKLLPARLYLETLGIGLVVFIVLNLACDVYFQLTQPAYGFLDNIRYSLAIAQGYNRTMGFKWEMDIDLTFILLLIIGFNFAGVLWWCRSSTNVEVIHHLLILLISGCFHLRGAITRSDIVHIVFAVAIHTFLLIMMIVSIPNRHLKTFGATLLVFWVIFNPYRHTGWLKHLLLLGSGQITLEGKAQEVWASSADISGIAPPELRDALERDKKIVNFPWANETAMALDMPAFAPVLQTYAAHDEQLQKMYVDRLHAMRSQVEVVYAVDDVSRFAGRLDGVQNVSRVPIIAEYLIEHFRLKQSRVFGDGLYVLTPREQPIELQRSDLPFTVAHENDVITIQVSREATCTFVEPELIIDYPMTAIVGRPNSLIATVSYRGNSVASTGLVAIEEGRPFTTLIYVGQYYAYSQVFDAHPQRDTMQAFDTITLALAPASLFTVNPTRLDITGVRCVTIPSSEQVEQWKPYVLTQGEVLNLWEHTWLPSGGGGSLWRTNDGFFIHSGSEMTQGPYRAPQGMCLTVAASFHPEVYGKPEADGAEFVATILPQTGAPISAGAVVEPGETSPIRVAVPAEVPFIVRFETRPRGNSAWDWAIWRMPRLEPCVSE